MSIVLDNMPKTLSTTQAAEHFGVHIKTIFRWIDNGKLSAEKVNGQWHVQIEAHDVQNAQNIAQDNAQNIAQGNVQTDHLIEQLQSENAHLRDQLARRDEQLDHAQQLLAVSQKSIQQLTEQNQLLIEDKRKPLWKRLFQRR